MTEKDLVQLRDKIDQAKQELASLEGQEKMILKSLQQEFDCNNVKEAKELHEERVKELEKLEDEITEDLNQLELDYGKTD